MSGKELFQRLFFACDKTLTSINKASEKAAPPVVSHTTQRSLQPITAIPINITQNDGVFVRLPPIAIGAERWRLP